MEIDRRSLMKGLAGAGALLAFGPPRRARSDESLLEKRRCALLLGHGAVDAAFERGARNLLVRAGQPEPEVVRWPGGPLARPALFEAWSRRSGATRCLVVLDDAGGAVFQETVRSAGARLLSRGTHVGSPADAIPLRHDWLAASPAWGAGAVLASRLLERGGTFRITESFLATTAAGARPLDRSVFPGRTGSWIECVAEAVVASALRLGAEPDAPAERTFTQRGGASGEEGVLHRFVSFVVDV